MAPEVLLKQPVSQASDVYSFAVTLNELATAVVPFSDCTKENPEVGGAQGRGMFLFFLGSLDSPPITSFNTSPRIQFSLDFLAMITMSPPCPALHNIDLVNASPSDFRLRSMHVLIPPSRPPNSLRCTPSLRWGTGGRSWQRQWRRKASGPCCPPAAPRPGSTSFWLTAGIGTRRRARP